MQYSSQPTASHTQHVSTSRLLALASRWQGIREYGLNFADLFTQPKPAADGSHLSIEVPAEAAQVSHTFYRKSPPSAASPAVAAKDKETPASTPAQTPIKPKASAAPTAPVTPAAILPASTTLTSSGMVTVQIPSLLDSDKRAVDILADAIEAHAVPDDEKFELLCKIRCALALGKGQEKAKEREKLGVVRLLAIAIFGDFYSPYLKPRIVAHLLCYGSPHAQRERSTKLFIYIRA